MLLNCKKQCNQKKVMMFKYFVLTVISLYTAKYNERQDVQILKKNILHLICLFIYTLQDK